MYESLRGLQSNIRIITNCPIGPDFKCLFSLRPILQQSVMDRSSVPYQGQRLPLHFGGCFSTDFGILTMNVYTLAENYDCMQMAKFVCSYSGLYLYCERFILFSIDFSSPNCFSISEPISLMTRSFMLSLTLHSPISPLYDIPWACHRVIREWSISTHLGLLNSCFRVKSSLVKFPPIGAKMLINFCRLQTVMWIRHNCIFTGKLLHWTKDWWLLILKSESPEQSEASDLS